MGFFNRVSQIWKGKASGVLSSMESNNPEAVYEAAVLEREKQYGELKTAVAELVMLRNKTREELEAGRRELAELEPMIATAAQGGEDEAALVLLERRSSLTTKTAAQEAELANLTQQVTETTEGLRSFQTEIDKLKREKSEMLARKGNAEARLEVQDSLSTVSTAVDNKGLSNVREHIERLSAGAGLEEGVSRPKVSAAELSRSQARAQLAALKRQLASSDAPAESAEGEEPAQPEDDTPSRTL